MYNIFKKNNKRHSFNLIICDAKRARETFIASSFSFVGMKRSPRIVSRILGLLARNSKATPTELIKIYNNNYFSRKGNVNTNI